MKKIVKYNTKIVERAGSKLRHILSNSNPWKGKHCEREDCHPCSQQNEKKDDCRKRSIIYENSCIVCNPAEKKTKNKKDLEDDRRTPSIYVGESAGSLDERTREHLKDATDVQVESHMRKHWEIEHGDLQGPPRFKMKVIKYCRSALERQIGEATSEFYYPTLVSSIQ